VEQKVALFGGMLLPRQLLAVSHLNCVIFHDIASLGIAGCVWRQACAAGGR
jgi:hypothetical protein